MLELSDAAASFIQVGCDRRALVVGVDTSGWWGVEDVGRLSSIIPARTEATSILQNCPTIKMDADADGVPCGRQW